MPQAVTHILFPILLISLFRDFYLKRNIRKKFPLHYVLIAGIGGVLPDIDLVFSVLLNFLNIASWNIHKTFTHSIFFPLSLFILFLIFIPVKSKAKICNIGKHNLKLSLVFLMLSLGVLTHLILDTLFGNPSYLLYPISDINFALNLIQKLPKEISGFATALIDGILLVLWIVYLETKHKISDFI